MARVVTSERAVELIGRLQADIGQANERLQQMLRTGDELASPQVWEGHAANRFRDDEWARTRSWTANSIAQLEELQAAVLRVNEAIRDAGGGLG
jgi:uncharacterized protein YukE